MNNYMYAFLKSADVPPKGDNFLVLVDLTILVKAFVLKYVKIHFIFYLLV